VYSREIDGRLLTFAPSGWTYKNTFVLYDQETGSLWYPTWRGLKAIQGEYFGRILPKVKFDDTIWRKWQQKHPKTKILK
jgi:hypothetical protein